MFETNELNDMNGKIEERIRGDIKQDKGVSKIRYNLMFPSSYRRKVMLMDTI